MVFWPSATYTYLEEESLCPLSTGFQVVQFPPKSRALPGAVFNLSFFFLFFPSVVVVLVLVGAEALPGLMLTTSVLRGGGSVCLQWQNCIESPAGGAG